MNIIINDISYKKSDKSTQKVIDKGISKLYARISEYERNGTKISCIFNDDTLIHDIIRKTFYVYKCRIDKVQLRILYTIHNDEIIIISHYCKKQNSKDYIAHFEKAAAFAALQFTFV